MLKHRELSGMKIVTQQGSISITGHFSNQEWFFIRFLRTGKILQRIFDLGKNSTDFLD